jgi:hypothetical protein
VATLHRVVQNAPTLYLGRSGYKVRWVRRHTKNGLMRIGCSWAGLRLRGPRLATVGLVLVFLHVSADAQNRATSTSSDSGNAVSLSSPLDYQIFQRQSRTRGFIALRGNITVPANRAEARVMGQSPSGPLQGKWKSVTLNKRGRTFYEELETTAGGFYAVEVRVLDGSRLVGTATVPHVGVGEVFVISGQSNSTNYGEVAQRTETGMVTTFSGDNWRLADDPQPGAQDGSKKGSFAPSFGDALYVRYGVPIGIAAVGHGSTSVRQWLPAGEPVKVMPTMTKYIVLGEDGVLRSDGTLFNGMMKRIGQLGVHGFHAVLWHQGESDSHQSPEHDISAETYRMMLEHLILAVRGQAGWKIPWFVAQASYHTPEDTSCPPIREVQRNLWQSGVALQGPDTDTLTARYRQNNGKGTHFNDAGLKAHGLLWAQAVEAYLNAILR